MKYKFLYFEVILKMLVRNISNSESLKTIKFENGEIYQGNTIMNEGKLIRHGYGKNFTKDRKYHGQYENDVENGNGIEILKGIIYTGEFKDGLKHGKGKSENRETNITYIGEFFNGLKHGNGIEIHKKTNNKYDVSYNMGISNSIIPFHKFVNGVLKIEAFKYQDKIVGPCKLYNERGSVIYEGEYEDGFKKGKLKNIDIELNGNFVKTSDIESEFKETGSYDFTGDIIMPFSYLCKYLAPYEFILKAIPSYAKINISGNVKLVYKINTIDEEKSEEYETEVSYQLIDIEGKYANELNDLKINYSQKDQNKVIKIKYTKKFYNCSEKTYVIDVTIENEKISGSLMFHKYYEGDFNNRFHYEGKGKLYNKNSDGSNTIIYEGDFINNKYNGFGVTYKKSSQGVNYKEYEGNWLDNYKNGAGIEYYENGQIKYEGNYYDNIPSGEGTLYDDSGNLIFSGQFEEGAPQLIA